jgi:hypothetical protein
VADQPTAFRGAAPGAGDPLLPRSQISKVYTHYAAVALFFFFGLKTLYDAFFKKDDVSAHAATALERSTSSAAFPFCASGLHNQGMMGAFRECRTKSLSWSRLSRSSAR